MAHSHTRPHSIAVGIANDIGDHLNAIDDAYRHDASLLVLPALSAGASLTEIAQAARRARLHVLIGTDLLIDPMGAVLKSPPFDTPFGRLSTIQSTDASVHYVTLTLAPA